MVIDPRFLPYHFLYGVNRFKIHDVVTNAIAESLQTSKRSYCFYTDMEYVCSSNCFSKKSHFLTKLVKLIWNGYSSFNFTYTFLDPAMIYTYNRHKSRCWCMIRPKESGCQHHTSGYVVDLALDVSESNRHYLRYKVYWF